MRTALVPVVLLVACGNQAPPPPSAPVRECPVVASASAPAPSASPSASTTPPPPVALTEIQALERLFSKPSADPAWFSPAFLEKVPASKIDTVLAGLRTSVGAFVSATKLAEHKLESKFEKGKIETIVVLDEQSRFTGLLFKTPQLDVVSYDDAIKAFESLPGTKSLVVITDGKERTAVSADQPLAVGSTFKLAVLSALRASIDAKKKSWKDVVELQAKWRSLPSGMLQDWPDKTAITLQSLASLMISKSDNTATDALIDLVGRPAIEKLAPKNKPFLTTREMFVLKWGGGGELESWQKGLEDTRRELLVELAKKPLPSVDKIGNKPREIGIEWFFTTRETCALMEKVQDLPLMSINPGVANAKDWERVAYKGGSEPGVLNFTTYLVSKSQTADKPHRHCVSATFNDSKSALPDDKIGAWYGQLLAALKAP